VRIAKVLNFLRLIFVPLEFFIVAYAIVQSLDGNPFGLIGLAAYAVWLIYSSGFVQALVNLSIGAALGIAYILGGWIWFVVAFIAIILLYEIYAKLFPTED
jgi:hypothetical protein